MTQPKILGSLAAMALIAAASAVYAAPKSAEFDLDENYANAEPAAGEEYVLAPGEIDPNALADGESMPIPAEEAAPAPAPKPVVKKAPEQKPVERSTEPPRDIPMIEMSHESHSHPEVTFVTGGIGDDERQAIEAAKADYNLYVMSASTTGAFVGDSRVIIMRKADGKDEEMLSVTAGPVLYVRLPAGSYTLYAKLGEETKKQNFTIHQKGAATRVGLQWKQ